MKPATVLGAAVCAIALFGACSPPPPAGCIPGMTSACACVGGATGAQTCMSDRTFGACACPGVDAATDALPAVDAPAMIDGPSPDAPDAAPDATTSDAPTPDAPPADAPSCAAPLVTCSGRCTDTSIDPMNCGSCGHACAADTPCYAGTCGVTPSIRHYTSMMLSGEPFLDACAMTGHDTVLAAGSTGAAPISLPFPLTLYDHTVRVGTVIANGAIYFDSLPPSWLMTCAPNSLYTIGAYVPTTTMFASLDLRSGICLATIGASPFRRYVATWTDAGVASLATTHLTFSIALHEGTDVVDVMFNDVRGLATDGAGSAVGVYRDRTEFTQPGCNMSGWARAGVTYRFTPMP